LIQTASKARCSSSQRPTQFLNAGGEIFIAKVTLMALKKWFQSPYGRQG